MAYEIYKVMHIVSIVTLCMCLAVSYTSNAPKKIFSIVGGIASLLVLVSGMGLLARIGVSMKEALPLWTIIKLVGWALIAILGAVVAKRVQHGRQKFFWILILLVAVMAYSVIYKI